MPLEEVTGQNLPATGLLSSALFLLAVIAHGVSGLAVTCALTRLFRRLLGTAPGGIPRLGHRLTSSLRAILNNATPSPVQDPARRRPVECAQAHGWVSETERAAASINKREARTMAQAATAKKTTNGSQAPLTLDAAVIGAGVAGLYQLHLLRQQGLTVKAFDAASDVGGTWYWNRYPGARFDSEAYIYQYLFSEDLYKGWSWSEKFPGQPEIERWMHYVADKLDLGRDIQFNTTIQSAHFDEATGRWTVSTDKGQIIDTQYLVTCCGMLSAPLSSLFPGQETFKGQLFHTARWPNEVVDLAGK